MFLFNILVTSYMTYYMSYSQTRFKINTGWKDEDDTDIGYIRTPYCVPLAEGFVANLSEVARS